MKSWVSIIAVICISIITHMAWDTIGFNENLVRNDIHAQQPQELGGLQFEKFAQDISGEKIGTQIAGNLVGQGISASNITTGTMSFDRAQGGSLILGGENNQNGTFTLRDADNIDRITMDKDGMIIDKGSMTIKNAKGQTIIDANGLRSTTNFSNGIITDSNLFSTTSTTYVDVTNMTLTFILSRGSNVLVGGGGACWNSHATNNAQFRLEIDGVLFGPTLPGQPASAATPIFSSMILNLSAGPHTLKQKLLAVNAGEAFMPADVKTLFYIILGN